MRILHIIPSFASGGAERMVLNYLMNWTQFSNDQVSALALLSNSGSIFDKQIEEKNLDVIYGNCKINNRFRIVCTIRKVINEKKPDIIHSHMRILPYVCLATIGTKTKIVHTIHTTPEVSSSGKIRLFDTFCFKYLKITPICLNKEMAQRANKLYGISSSKYLYNGIQLSEYTSFNKKEKIALRKKLNIPEDAYIVGHIGRFVPIKNHELIINAFSILKKTKEDAHLILIGEGPEVNYYKNIVEAKGLKNCVHFLGTRIDVPELLQIMDVFIFPSKVEGLGISLIEAQAAGLPCVVSDRIPTEAIVSDDVIRIRLTDDINLWAKALNGDGRRTKKHGSLENFDISKVNEKLRGIYIDATRKK